jgi:hypothetical protein
MPLTRTQALERLAWMVASDQYPFLDSTALQQLVDDHARWTVWTASTAYVYGDIIIPTVANGRLYKCIIAGTSDTTEPEFPQWVTNSGYTINDGSGDLQWQDIGPANVERYDIRAAARQGWIRKASSITHLIDVKDGQVDAKMAGLREHCLDQAKRYSPMVFV